MIDNKYENIKPTLFFPCKLPILGPPPFSRCILCTINFYGVFKENWKISGIDIFISMSIISVKVNREIWHPYPPYPSLPYLPIHTNPPGPTKPRKLTIKWKCATVLSFISWFKTIKDEKLNKWKLWPWSWKENDHHHCHGECSVCLNSCEILKKDLDQACKSIKWRPSANVQQ